MILKKKVTRKLNKSAFEIIAFKILTFFQNSNFVIQSVSLQGGTIDFWRQIKIK